MNPSPTRPRAKRASEAGSGTLCYWPPKVKSVEERRGSADTPVRIDRQTIVGDCDVFDVEGIRFDADKIIKRAIRA